MRMIPNKSSCITPSITHCFDSSKIDLLYILIFIRILSIFTVLSPKISKQINYSQSNTFPSRMS